MRGFRQREWPYRNATLVCMRIMPHRSLVTIYLYHFLCGRLVTKRLFPKYGESIFSASSRHVTISADVVGLYQRCSFAPFLPSVVLSLTPKTRDTFCRIWWISPDYHWRRWRVVHRLLPDDYRDVGGLFEFLISGCQRRLVKSFPPWIISTGSVHLISALNLAGLQFQGLLLCSRCITSNYKEFRDSIFRTAPSFHRILTGRRWLSGIVFQIGSGW